MSDMELFKSAGLYDEDKMSGNKGFNLAGILLFAKDDVLQSCVPGYVTDCLLRRDNLDRYDDRLIVDTNLIEAYDKIIVPIALQEDKAQIKVDLKSNHSAINCTLTETEIIAFLKRYPTATQFVLTSVLLLDCESR